MAPVADPDPPPLVGRAAELAALEELVRHARRGGIGVVEGEAGIGKTRLLDAAVEFARGRQVTVLRSKAEELEARRPFGPIVDLAGRDRLESVLGPWHAAPGVAAEREHLVAEKVLEMLDELCRSKPVVVVVEDLHWADPATLGVLGRLAARFDLLPATLLVSARPQPRPAELDRLLAGLAGRRAVRVEPGPLDDASVRTLLEAVLGAAPGEQLVRQARRAAGNPLLLGELVETLHAGAAPSLSLSILRRTRFLPPEAVELLGLAAVLGASFGAADLARLAGRPVSELAPVLLAALRAGILGERGDRLAFRHELVRDALYEDMPLSVRRGLHAQVAGALRDAGEPVEHLAEHLLRGAEPGNRRAIDSLTAAARDLSARSPSVAIDLYQRSIALAPDSQAQRTLVLPELAVALVAAGRLQDGERACREALADDADGDWVGRLLQQLVFVLLRRGRVAATVGEGEAALAIPELAGFERMRVRASISMARAFLRDAERAAREARSVLDESDDEVARGIATNALAVIAGARGRFTEAAELTAPGVQWADRTRSRAAFDTRPHTIHGQMLLCIDRLDEARATIERGRRGAEALGIADALPLFSHQLALVDFSRGRLDDAQAELSAAVALAERTDLGRSLPAEALRALIAIHRDDLLAAERHLAVADEIAAAGGPPHGKELMVLARTELLDATGRRAEALDHVAAAYEAIAAERELDLLPVVGLELARLAAAAGEPERGRRAIADLEEIAERNPGALSLVACPLQARGLLDGDPEALLAALELLRDTGRELERARAAEDAAALAGGTRELLEEAREIYERAGATRDVARVDAALRAVGARRGVSGRRNRPASGWAALTDTELKVVRLVAERLTNPEIAERMFISRRTVQTHVSHALAKVGVSTRRELATEADRRGGWQFRADGVSAVRPRLS
ncbi:MAG TPA: AAA family ATPase [Thermoleophilaceae bacterium]